MITNKYILLLKRYLNNQLTKTEKDWFENRLIQDVVLCEELKASCIMPDHIFLKMYKAIKEKTNYHNQRTSA